MQFQPKTEDEIARERLREEGKYPFTVTSAVDKVSKNNNPMIVVELDVFDTNGNAFSITDYIMASMAFKLRHFAFCVGLGADYEAGILHPESMAGKSGTLKLGIQAGKDGYPPKNVVKDYDKDVIQSVVKPAMTKVADVSNDCAPF